MRRSCTRESVSTLHRTIDGQSCQRISDRKRFEERMGGMQLGAPAPSVRAGASPWGSASWRASEVAAAHATKWQQQQRMQQKPPSPQQMQQQVQPSAEHANQGQGHPTPTTPRRENRKKQVELEVQSPPKFRRAEGVTAARGQGPRPAPRGPPLGDGKTTRYSNSSEGHDWAEPKRRRGHAFCGRGQRIVRRRELDSSPAGCRCGSRRWSRWRYGTTTSFRPAAPTAMPSTSAAMTRFFTR